MKGASIQGAIQQRLVHIESSCQLVGRVIVQAGHLNLRQQLKGKQG